MIESIYELIPAELLKQNRRFNYADIRKGLKYERIEDSFLWLRAAGAALCCFNVTEPKIALKQNEKSSLLKLYLSDVGLLSEIYGSSVKLDLVLGDKQANYGGIYENFVAMELIRHGFELYYYNSRKMGELDFVIEYHGRVLPIEVKSGKDYYVHSAINNVLSEKQFGINEAIVFSNANIQKDGAIIYYPIYMCTFLESRLKLPVVDPRS